jgi:hypothetical protein
MSDPDERKDRYQILVNTIPDRIYLLSIDLGLYSLPVKVSILSAVILRAYLKKIISWPSYIHVLIPSQFRSKVPKYPNDKRVCFEN